MATKKLICPFKAEAYISHIDAINAYASKVLSNDGERLPDDKEIDKLVRTFTECCKSECAAWHKVEIYSDDEVVDYGWCVRAKGAFE